MIRSPLAFLLLLLFMFIALMPAQESDSLLRPMRSVETPNPDHPKNRNLLPPFYTEGKIYYYESQIITQTAMEHPRTQFYIQYYTGMAGLNYLSSVMERGGPYYAFIMREIAQMNLPPELIYLPVIESSFVASALSRSGASGLWQFMTNSMEPFDMRVSSWMDERRDFWKATQGGLRKLEENFNFFGDWYVALAAYNAGLGALNRMVQQSGSASYWRIREMNLLAAETANYVPRFVAVSYVLTNQRRYGMDVIWPDDPNWQRIPVDRSVDLRILAAHSGVDPEELIWANRELLYNITPPDGGYFLKVSEENAERVMAVLNRRDLPLVHHYIHTIRSGDTFSALARHFGVTVDQIESANPGVEARFLRIGTNLIIPALRDAGPYVRPRPESVLEFNGTHLVKRGETLWSIAFAYEVDPEILAEANDMEISDILHEGRVLRTPIR